MTPNARAAADLLATTLAELEPAEALTVARIAYQRAAARAGSRVCANHFCGLPFVVASGRSDRVYCSVSCRDERRDWLRSERRRQAKRAEAPR